MGKSAKSKFKTTSATVLALPVSQDGTSPTIRTNGIQRPAIDVKLSLTPWIALAIFAIIGLFVHLSGLTAPYQRDDLSQIQENGAVHSIANLPKFFTSSTFEGANNQSFAGSYYRPLMTTSFSIIYTFFHNQTLAYHIIQLVIAITGVFFLYLILLYYMRPPTALALATIFLVHPLNSQAIYYIAALQDVLYFTFGMLALWLLHRSRSVSSLWLATGCILLSLLSKETGIVFAIIAPIYLWIFHKQRLLAFIGTLAPAVVLYLILKTHAVGLVHASHSNPINYLNFAQRVTTMPAIVLFYLTKMVYPVKLALAYYWVYPTVSWSHVIWPLIVDIACAIAAIAIGKRLRQAASPSAFRGYIFFSVWLIVAMLPAMQFISLDMTVCDTWFLTPMAGLLGMIGIAITTLKLSNKWLAPIAILLMVTLSILTYARGHDYSITFYSIDVSDIRASKEDFQAYAELSTYYSQEGTFKYSESYARESLALFSQNVNGYTSLAASLMGQGRYPEAVAALNDAHKYSNEVSITQNLCLLTLVNGEDAQRNEAYLHKEAANFPDNVEIWLDQARFYRLHGNSAAAKNAMRKAASLGSVDASEYNGVMENKLFTLSLGNSLNQVVFAPITQ